MARSDRFAPVAKAATYAALGILAALMLLPFAWTVRSSLCDDLAVVQPMERITDLLPPRVHPENYANVFREMPFLTYFLNTAFIAFGVVTGTVVSSSLCAFAFVFCAVPYGRKIFYAVLATMMLPAAVTMIPAFILFRELGWIDTFKPLIVPAFCGNAFAIFLFRQFFMGLPKELLEAARIDGASNLLIYWRIVMPLARPATITVAIFAFMGTWNDFMGPLIFLNSKENWTLQLGLNSLKGLVASQWNLLMAAAVIVVLPVLIVFLCLQRYLIRGIALTGVKG